MGSGAHGGQRIYCKKSPVWRSTGKRDVFSKVGLQTWPRAKPDSFPWVAMFEGDAKGGCANRRSRIFTHA